MCSSILANAPQLRKDLLSPERAAQQNQLIQMLAAGAEVVRHTGQVREVALPGDGRVYRVHVQWTQAGSRYETCTCARRFQTRACVTHNCGTQQVNHEGPVPCPHILLVRWHELDALDRAALLLVNDALRAAFLAGQRGVTPPAPVAVAPPTRTTALIVAQNGTSRINQFNSDFAEVAA